jgi:hypothetical protein
MHELYILFIYVTEALIAELVEFLKTYVLKICSPNGMDYVWEAIISYFFCLWVLILYSVTVQ